MLWVVSYLSLAAHGHVVEVGWVQMENTVTPDQPPRWARRRKVTLKEQGVRALIPRFLIPHGLETKPVADQVRVRARQISLTELGLQAVMLIGMDWMEAMCSLLSCAHTGCNPAGWRDASAVKITYTLVEVSGLVPSMYVGQLTPDTPPDSIGPHIQCAHVHTRTSPHP